MRPLHHTALGALAGATLASVVALTAVPRSQAPLPISDTAAMIAAHVLPDPKLTPGATLPVTVEIICVPGYSKSVRNVPQSEKDQVYAEYGITSHPKGSIEIDHLCSLELSGSNNIQNLWPEPYDVDYQGYQMGAHEKDKVEDATHRAVCSGEISLAEALNMIEHDWTELYRRFVSPTFPKWVGPTMGVEKP